MKFTLKDVFKLFTPLAEMPPEIQTIKNNFPLRIFSDISSGLAISDVSNLNFSEFIKTPNLRQNRGTQPRAKQYASKFVTDSQQKTLAHQNQMPEEPIHWDKPDPSDKFDDLLCPDFRTAGGKESISDSFRSTTASDAVLDVMDLISAPDSRKNIYSNPKHQSALTSDLPVETANESDNAGDRGPIGLAGDDIEDVLQKLEQGPVTGPNTIDSLPESQGISEHGVPQFPVPPTSDPAIFGFPTLPYTQVIPGIQPISNQLVFPVYHPQQQIVGLANPMGAAPSMQPMHGIPAIPAVYTMPVQQTPQTYDVSWEYLDLNNIMRGPFPSVTMWKWYKQGSLPNTLRIRVAGDTGPFLPLFSRWAKSLARGVDPFSVPPSELSYQ